MMSYDTPKTPKFCEYCGLALIFVPTSGTKKYDLYTGRLIKPASGLYRCTRYEDDFRGEGNGHTYIRWPNPPGSMGG